MDLGAAASDTSAPVEGLRAVASLRTLVDALESRQVEEAPRSGESWSSITAALGVTRQAVHKKYGKRPRHIGPTEKRAGVRNPPTEPAFLSVGRDRAVIEGAASREATCARVCAWAGPTPCAVGSPAAWSAGSSGRT